MVRASGIRGYAALMRNLRVDPHALLARYEIDEQDLGDDENLLSLRSVIHLLEDSAAVTGCGDFGLRLAERQDVNILGPFGILLQSAETIRDAMNYGSRFMFVHSPGLGSAIHDPSELVVDAVEFTVDISLANCPLQRQAIDLTLGAADRVTRMLAGEHYRLHSVTLPHTPLVPISHYRRFFAAPVIVNRERAGLHIGNATLNASMRSENPVLRRMTEEYLQREFRNPSDSLMVRVRHALRRMLGSGQASRANVAAMLAMHPRTMQRHLDAAGVSFDGLRDSVRQELALHYLRETRIPLGQLAGLLGFSEQSALSRSCRRWFGETPSGVRVTGCLSVTPGEVDAGASFQQTLVDRLSPDERRPRQGPASAPYFSTKARSMT